MEDRHGKEMNERKYPQKAKSCGLDKGKRTGEKEKVSKCFYPEDPIKFDKFKKEGESTDGYAPTPARGKKKGK